MINFSYYTNKDAPEWIKGRKEQEVREADKARNWAIGGAAGKSLIGLRELLKDMYDKKLYQLNDEGMPVWRKRDDVGFVDSIIPDKGEYEKIPYDVKETVQSPSNLAGPSTMTGAVSPEATGLLSYLTKGSGGGKYGLPKTFAGLGKQSPKTFAGLSGSASKLPGIPDDAFKTFKAGEAAKAGEAFNTGSKALNIGGTALSAAGNTIGAGMNVYNMLNAQNSKDSWKGGVGLASNLLGLLGLVTLNPFATALGGAGSLVSMFA